MQRLAARVPSTRIACRAPGTKTSLDLEFYTLQLSVCVTSEGERKEPDRVLLGNAWRPELLQPRIACGAPGTKTSLYLEFYCLQSDAIDVYVTSGGERNEPDRVLLGDAWQPELLQPQLLAERLGRRLRYI